MHRNAGAAPDGLSYIHAIGSSSNPHLPLQTDTEPTMNTHPTLQTSSHSRTVAAMLALLLTLTMLTGVDHLASTEGAASSMAQAAQNHA
jgi:hypothetical protein